MQENLFSSNPYSNLKGVKYLMIALAATSLLSPIITFFLTHYFNLPGPQEIFPLSLYYLEKGYFFEIFTYPLIHLEGTLISLSSLVSLFLRIGLLWFASSEVANQFGQKLYFWFFFSTILFVGLLITAILFFTKSTTPLFGSTPILFALLTLWLMSMKGKKFVLHPLVQVKAKTVAYVIFGTTLLINLSYGDILFFVANLTGIFYGFIFAVLLLKLPLPFVLPKMQKRKKKKKHTSADIIDITSISNDPDDLFIDEMLDKIARVGREGLTKREKERMDTIVRRRRSSKDL